LIDGKAKPNVEKSPEEAATGHNRVPEVKAETRIEVGTSSQQPPNWTVQFPKPDHPVSSASGQNKPLRTTMPRTSPAPRRCPPGLTPS
jgi:hypothetical protein